MEKKNKVFLIIGYCLLGLLFVFNIFASVYFLTDNTEKIFDENIFKVVEVKSLVSEDNWGYATGCFIDNNGTILTNKHVVQSSSSGERYGQIMVRTADSEEWVTAEVVKVSEEHDLATIKCNLQKDCFSLSENVKNGETVYTIGNPDGFGLSFISGVVSSNSRNVVYEGKTINTIQTSFVINEGNSGGPVFNKKGELLGIISFRLKNNQGEVVQGAAFVIPTKSINNFLQNNV